MSADKPTQLADNPTELSRIKLKKTWKTWTQQPIPMISKHSANLTPLPFGIRTWLWRYTYLLLFMTTTSDFRIERRQVFFLCWMQDSYPEGLWNPIFSRLNACWQTYWAIEDQAKKLELDSPSLWSASIQPTWPFCHLAFAPGFGDIHICCCSCRCSGTGKRFSNRKETSCLPLLNAGSEPRGSLKPNFQQTECLLTNRLSYRGSS